MSFDIDILTFLGLGDCLGSFLEKMADFLKHLVTLFVGNGRGSMES